MPTQQSETREYAVKHGLFLDDEYPEPAVSARKLRIEDRPQMWRLYNDILAGEIHTLLVYKRDRLARQATEYLRIYDALRKHNVKVLFTADNEFPMIYSPIGEFFELFMAGVIEREGDQIAERISATRIAKFAEGNYATKSPYGYIRDKSKSGKPFARVEEELRVARRVFDLVLGGSCNKVSDVVNSLFNEGIKFKVNRKQENGNRAIEESTPEYRHITNIIRNPIYMGEHVMRFSGEEKTKNYEGLGIVTYEEWWEAQDRLDMMITRRDKLIHTEQREYVLHGLLWCKVCGAKMDGIVRQRKWQPVDLYQCPNHKEIAIRCDELEPLIESRVNDMLDGLLSVHFYQLMRRYIENNEAKLRTLIDEQTSRIKLIDRKLANRVSRFIYADTVVKKSKLEDDIVELNRMLEIAKGELEGLQKALGTLESTLPRASEMRAHLKNKGHRMNLRELFQETVRRIELGPYGLDIALRHPFLEMGEVLIREA